MSDARGGFLPTSSLACWLTNGLLSVLADQLAGPQRLLLPYLVAQGWVRGYGGGEVAEGGEERGGGTLFTRRVRRSERQSAMEQTQIT